MLGKFFVWVGVILVGLPLVFLLALVFPTLPSRIEQPSLPFLYVVKIDDTLALVEQEDLNGEWQVQDSAWSMVESLKCHCPDLSKANNLLKLQRYSNLEMIELFSPKAGVFCLQASRDDLGGPKVAYIYECNATGIRPLLRYDSFFGFSYPVLGWAYYAFGMVLWSAACVGLFLLGKRFRMPKSEPNPN